MQTIDTIIQATWIIPVIPKGKIYQDHSLVIDQGKIIAIEPSEQVSLQYKANKLVNLDQHILIPGLINSHTHSPMNLMRGLADDLPLMQWLEKHIWPAEAEFVNQEFVMHGTELAIAEMLRSGTTTFNDMYFFPDITASVAQKTGIRTVLGQIVIDFPSAWASNTQDYLQKGLDLHEQVSQNPLLTTCMAPHAPYTVNDENLKLTKQQADKLGIPIHIHLHETLDEITQSLSTYKLRPIERLHQLGLLSDQLIAVHMTQLDQAEQELILKTKVNIAHCPESNMKLASGIAPVNQLLQRGANISLGTDSAASNNDLDMIGEMKTAGLLSKVSTMDATALNAETILEMATINGAKALNLDKVVGSLEIGKEADICAVQMENIECLPLYHPISQLIYSASRHQVSNVWVRGKHLLKDFQLTQIDTTQVIQYAKMWHQRLQHLK